MPETMLYRDRELLEPGREEVRNGPCDHTAVWVVDLASRRVIRAVCAACGMVPRRIARAGGSGLALIR
jgi:hypothetical protein